jgi:Fic family protein
MIATLQYKDVYEPVWQEYQISFNEVIVQAELKRIALKQTNITKDIFGFYTSIASVFSSRIEGEQIELDSYIKHKFLSVTYQPDYTKKTDDLFNAYVFAKNNALNQSNLLHVHSLITKHLLTTDKQGRVRTQQMFVLAKDNSIEYVAADAAIVKKEFEKFISDLESLVKVDLPVDKAFFFASMLHLLFVKIHPMYDGNGRTARLLEKWFLAHHIGIAAWNIESERYFYENINAYYHSLQRLGLEYDSLSYSQSLPFTQLLLKSLEL